MARPPILWQCGDRSLPLGGAPRIMGILNVTPDSFSDGGAHATAGAAVAHGLRLLEEGADILDVGGESTRPGAAAVSAAEELARVLPVIRELYRQRPAALISIDTSKAEVADRALDAGARIVNDVTAGEGDPAMVGVVAAARAGFVLMHMQGTPRTMQAAPCYADVVGEVAAYLRARVAACEAAGIGRAQLVVDPGIGFGKTLEHNLALIRAAAGLTPEFPVLIGASRKSFLGKLTGREIGDRVAASVAVAIHGALHGVAILRVHDVKETVDALRVTAALTGER